MKSNVCLLKDDIRVLDQARHFQRQGLGVPPVRSDIESESVVRSPMVCRAPIFFLRYIAIDCPKLN